MKKRKAPSCEPEKSKTISITESLPAQEAKDNPAIRKIRLTLERSPSSGLAKAGAISAIYLFLLICTAPRVYPTLGKVETKIIDYRCTASALLGVAYETPSIGYLPSSSSAEYLKVRGGHEATLDRLLVKNPWTMT
jgi:hypothetical protein